MLEIDVARPPDFSIVDLRNIILKNLRDYGDPLRWAITDVRVTSFRIEAIMITSQSS